MRPVGELIDTIRKFHVGRQRGGLKRKYQRMSAGAFEFFRGTDFLFARAWPKLEPRWPGSAVWLCGDLHLENFGAFPTDDGEFRFDINDFDEAAVAPCSIDLVRCSTSILLAAESWRLSPTQGTGMVLAFLDSYRGAIQDGSCADGDQQPNLDAVGNLLDAVRLGSQEALLQRYAERWRDGKWRCRRTDPRVKSIGDKRRAEVESALSEFAGARGWQLLDIVKRFSGIGSLGLRRFPTLDPMQFVQAPGTVQFEGSRDFGTRALH
jgi:uncharacterized protein (DUF2252 family)